MSSLSDFDKPIADAAIILDMHISEAVDLLTKNAAKLESAHISKLVTAISESRQAHGIDTEKLTYDSDFSIASMISEQLNAVRSLRQSVFMDGTIKEGVSIRDAQSVISTTNSMITNLTKHHETVQGMERSRLMERSVVEVLKEISPELKDRFFVLLNDKLETL